MAKSTKIIAIILSVLVAGVCVAAGISSVRNNDNPDLPTVSDNTAKPTVSVTEPTTEPKKELSELILGKWTDSAQMSGFEFFSDGTVEITYVNLTVPVINIPVNGKTKGTYSISGDKLTTRCSIYSATIEYNYKVQIEGNELKLTDLEEFETATYMRATETAEPTTKVKETTLPSTKNNSGYDDEIIGSWENSKGDKYEFDYDGELEVTLGGKEYDGIYLAEGGKITLQYKKNGSKVTEKYTYTVRKNNLTLKDENAEIQLVREGTDNASVSASEDDLLGTWRDSADMSGFQFKPGGLCEITYVNLTIPVVNIPINGTFTGSYAVNGDRITITVSIYGSPIKDVYKFSVSGNTLTLKGIDNDNIITLTKQ